MHKYLCFLILLQILPLFTNADIYQNISLGSSLVAKDDQYSWPSPSGEFAFGFRKISWNGFMLAIWFNKISEKTIVWSVIDHVVPQGSNVAITLDGRFLLYNSKTGDQFLIANGSAATGVAYAAMLDTGNLVLANENSKILWETFRKPTDTILPTQVMNIHGMLHAQLTPKNYSSGRFQLVLKSDRLVFYTTHFPLDYTNFAYSVIKPKGGSAFFQLVFNQSGDIYLTDKNGSILHFISTEKVASEDYYQRATLEFDGVFKHYVYPKSSNSNAEKGWSFLAYEPPNICTAIQRPPGSASAGGGVCGLNSLCKHDDLV